MGEGATGYIQYTDDNWMTVQIMGQRQSALRLGHHDGRFRAAADAGRRHLLRVCRTL
ncbi:hypothetical protein [Pectobacterium brasiliense]|nr:hypothetical protein [Pectobacterium brasiliense]